MAGIFNQSIIENQWNERLNSAIVYSIFASVGVLINCVPIALSFFTRLINNNVNILVGHLAIVDLCVCLIFIIAQNFYLLFKDFWPSEICRWIGFISASCGFQVFIFPAFLSLNRYISLCHNHLYNRWNTRRNVLITIVISWAFVSSILLTFSLGHRTGFDDDNNHCCIIVKGSTAWTVYFWFVCMVPILGLGDGTVVFCNVKIYSRLKEHARAGSMSKNVMRKHKELLYFLIIEMIVPIFFHTVYLVAKFAYVDRQRVFWKQFFTILYFLNSIVRGIVTLTVLTPYRRMLAEVILGKKHESGTLSTAREIDSEGRESTKLINGDCTLRALEVS